MTATQFFIKAKFAVHKQVDGTLIATARGLPLVVVAKDDDELAERISAAMESLDRYFNRLGADGVREFLNEQDVEYEEFTRTLSEDDEEREMTLPVLVGAP